MKQAIIILITVAILLFSCGTGKAPQSTNNSIDNPDQTTQSDSATNSPQQNTNSAIAPPAYDPDNPVGGNINSKEPIAYADSEFLRGIIDYDSIATIEPPQGWPELLDNSFHIDYNSGEMRMVRPEMVFGVAEALGIETHYQADYLDIKNCDFRLYALYVQKVKSEVYFKALYNYDDKVPEYLAVYNKLENDSVANRKDLAIQRCYRLTDEGPLLMIDYYFNNYIFERPEDPMTGPLKSVDNISDYIKQVYGNVAVKDNKKLVITFIEKFKNIKIPENWRISTFIYNIDSFKKHYIVNPYNSIRNNADALDPIFTLWENPLLYPENYGVLIPEKNIFQYSLDKLIDNNPSTSFVEDSLSDLINIQFGLGNNNILIQAISIINGYAKNEELYLKNNRVKQCKIILKGYDRNEEYIFDLKNTIEPQLLKFKPIQALEIEVQITKIFKGSKYNDTCIAEINILTDKGWIF